jgi:hypothetical protein
LGKEEGKGEVGKEKGKRKRLRKGDEKGVKAEKGRGKRGKWEAVKW